MKSNKAVLPVVAVAIIGSIVGLGFLREKSTPGVELAYDLLSVAAVFLVFVCFIWARTFSKGVARKTSKMLARTRRLALQQESLLKLVTCSSIYSSQLEDAAREIAESATSSLNAVQTSVWFLDSKAEYLRCFDLYDQNLGRHYCSLPLKRSNAPEFFELVSKHRVIHFCSDDLLALGVNILPPTPSVVLFAAVHAEGTLAGFVCSVRMPQQKVWAVDEQNFLGSIADIISMVLQSQRTMQMEQELEVKSLAIESAMDGIAILDEHEHFQFVNNAYARIYGYQNPSELIGQHWSTLYDTDELKRFESHLMPRFRAHGHMNVEAEGKRKNGSLFPQEVSLTRLNNGGITCVVRDITIRKRVERRAEKVALFATLNPSPMMRFGVDGRILMANPAAIQIFGLSRSHSDYLQTIIPEISTGDLDTCIRSGDIRRFVVSYERRQYQFMLRGIPHLRAGHIYGTDITEQKTLHEQLVQSQKMEAIGQLAGGIAHDFNNILTGILGYTSLIRDERNTHENVIQTAELIEDAASKASELTQQLLGFARKGKHQSIPVNFHATIENSLKLLDCSIEKTITIEKSLHADAFHVLGDPTQLQQVVINLALNARDAMTLPSRADEKAGVLTVATDVVRVGGSHGMNVAGLKPGRYFELTIRDTGCGMGESTQQKIFEPFFTTKERGKGTGMGLAMVYGIVKSHEGAIEFESDIDLGTEFRIYLPITDAEVAAVVAKRPILRSGKGRILLVDDHSMIRDATSRMLESLGYEVDTAENGLEAVRFYEKYWSSVDLVILDMVMPKMGARECFRQIRRINPDVRAILSTGYVNNHVVQEIMDEGLLGFVQKPYQLGQLSEVVSVTLAAQ